MRTENIHKAVKAETQEWPVKPIIVVDNTFMSSYFQRPLSLGADMVTHSISKYMNGHTDVSMGALATNDEKINERLQFLQNSLGTVPSPFDCFLVNRICHSEDSDVNTNDQVLETKELEKRWQR